ncbi:MAG: ATP-binding cassette domain-containing protein [Lachnospiraceae bacterium]|nr:ATP-binding cassette domain-containing protein [Lachnospiraceae bacterium]
MENQKEILISARDLCKEFKSNGRTVHAVNHINLDIYKGETLGLVGESGCGKSTFGNMLVHLHTPDGGEILYQGEEISHLKKKELKQMYRKIQIIFQDPYSSLDPKKTIGWLIEEPLRIHRVGADKQERAKLVQNMLEVVGMDESYLDKYPDELSGGQRQRVAIAIALILNPEFVVCDEAVSALDVSVQAQVLNLLKKLQKQFSLTYLFISHNLNVVSYMSDRIGIMYLGEIVELGDVKEISANPLHPYGRALFSASLGVGKSNDSRIVLQGDLPSPSNPPGGCPFHTRCFMATEKCSSVKPELQNLGNGHYCACHRVEECRKRAEAVCGLEKKEAVTGIA